MWILQLKIRFFISFHFISFHCNPILDCNPNNSPPEEDRSDWYLKLVLDCSFYLVNQSRDFRVKMDFKFQLVSNLIQFSIEKSRFRLVKRNASQVFEIVYKHLLSNKSNERFSWCFNSGFSWCLVHCLYLRNLVTKQ